MLATNRMERFIAVLLILTMTVAQGQTADVLIVENGKPRAQILLSKSPPRLTRLAAEELRDYFRKITGAELPIVNEPSADYPLTIFVGRSAGTDEHGLTAESLSHGAYRIIAGEDWLALLGHDADFEPVEPWARRNGDRPRAQEEWERLTGGAGRNPMSSAYKTLHKKSGIWTKDEGGSLQAVYGYLRSLGVRWYMPGELGEVVPQRDSIKLPVIDQTVKPDFPYRDLRLGNVPAYAWEDFIWQFRLGLNNQGLAGSHGMGAVHGSAKMQEANPEYFALVGGQRCTRYRGTGHACFSSKGLLAETISYARARFDHFDLPAVSVFPQDGYHHCGCELCQDKSPSELVWGFVNNVAKELYKTHPDRIVLGGAYTKYRYPPETIERFSPNVAVRISWMRPGLDDDENWAEYWKLVEAWSKKLAPQRLMRNANIQWSASRSFPVLHPRSIAREFNAMRGLSLGESSSVPRSADDRWQNAGTSHLNVYVLSRYLWDARIDLDALLDEYYSLFYGPAADSMRKAFDFAESIYPRDGRPSPGRIACADRLQFVEMLHAARKKAGDTIYGKRIDEIIGDLMPIEQLKKLHAMETGRGDVRHFWTLMPADRKSWGKAVIDGELDELFWTGYRPQGTSLRPAKTGESPNYGTSFQLRWYGNDLYIGIRCKDKTDEPLNITSTADGDPAILQGDCVTVLLETQDHSFYEITVNPAGAVWDSDHAEDGEADRWSSQAEVATTVGEGYWNIEMRIPVVAQDDDPLHWVNGRQPSHTFPWHFNIARRRIRESGSEWSAFEPTGSKDFYDPLNFVRVYLRPGSRMRRAMQKDGVRSVY